ncbi:MAG: hypothetical protein V5A55_04495 [Halovenus sp.]
MRAISTVLDVTVCLLLLSAAVFVLALPVTEPSPERGADETAAVLSTTTVDLVYPLSAERFRGETGFEIGGEAARERQRHGTLAGLAGRAALASVVVDGEQVAPESAAFREEVAAELAAVTPARTFVTVHWEPYQEAAVSGRVEAGSEPPAGADVQAATRRVPLPALAVEPDGATFQEVATAVARSLVTALVPETAGARPMDDPPLVASTIHRYEALAGDLDARAAYLGGDVQLLVRAATTGLADSVAADLRERFESPSVAAAAVTAGYAWLTVERWES